MDFITIEEKHFQEVSDIYLQGIKTGLATFETDVPDWKKWDRTHLQFGRIAIVKNHKILGWASLLPTSKRKVYAGVAEVSVYVAEQERGKGIGQKLLKKLIAISEQNGIWTLQASIMKLNKASITLHQNCGFRIIGYREKIGNLNGIWKDNIILERRSRILGI